MPPAASQKCLVKETEWQFNARIGKTGQAVECLADIRWRGGRGSTLPVFDSEQPDGGSEQRTLGLRHEYQ